MIRALASAGVYMAGSLPRLRHAAVTNLRIAFGPSGPEIYPRALLRFADNISSVVSACSRNRYRRPVVRFDIDKFRAMVPDPPPYVCVTGHIGPFELLTTIQSSMNTTFEVVVRPPNSRLLRLALNFVRRRIGTAIIDKKNVWRESVRALSAGRSVALFADHNAGFHGVFVPFLGFAASTTRLPAMLARKFNKPIVMGFIRRDGAGHTAWIERVIRPDPAAGEPADELRMLKEMNDVFSDVIRKYPDEWFWFHRRWKTRPGDFEARILR